MSADPVERVDQLIAALEHQTAQIDMLTKDMPSSPPTLRFVAEIILKSRF